MKVENKTSTFLSIIIPVYNVGRYLQRCLDSVLEQISGKDEIILINDGSTDNSLSICLEYQKEYANVKFISQRNAGLGRTRNIGLLEASNENVIFLDSDDYWEIGTVNVIKSVISQEYIDILYFDAKTVYEGTIKEEHNPYNRKGKVSTEILSGKLFFEKYYPEGYIVQACMAVYKKDFLLKNKIIFQENVYFEDNLFSFLAVMKAEKVRYIPYQLYIRRMHENSIMTSEMSYRKIYDYSCVVHAIWDYIKTILDQLEGEILSKVILYVDSLLYTFCVMCRKVKEDLGQIHLLRVRVFRQYISLLDMYEENIKLVKVLRLVYGLKAGSAEFAAVTEIFGGKRDYERTLSLYKQQYKKRVIEKILLLYIDQPECKTGIYGLGKQTECLIEFCSQHGIETKNVIYVDSYQKTGKQNFYGCAVKNIRDVGDCLDKLIISSGLYRNEMYEMAKRFLPVGTEIVFLYEDGEEDIIWDLL